ncbi:MAG: sigma-70 family RNA polymerase sigma factor [Chitinophagales bacterium]
MQTDSDIKDIRQTIKGNHAAFERLMNRHKALVYTLALRLVSNPQEAEEVAQDAFVKAFHSLTSFEGKSKFSTWLYSITYKTAISHLRAQTNKKALYNNREPQDYDVSSTQLPQFSKLKAEQRQQFIQQAIATLPSDEASIITLFYLHELSLKEIVEVMNISLSNAKVKLHRARKKLLPALQDLLKEEVREIL